MKKEDCEGCRSYRGKCLWYDDDLTCPCSICLVKMICIESCELLDDYIQSRNHYEY